MATMTMTAVPYLLTNRAVGDSPQSGADSTLVRSASGKLKVGEGSKKLKSKKVTYKTQFLEKSSAILTIRELATNFLQVCEYLRGWWQNQADKLKASSFLKGLAQANLPFRCLGLIVFMFGILDDSKAIHKARKKKDREKLRDHSLNLVSNVTCLADTAISTALCISRIKAIALNGLMSVSCAMSMVAFSLMMLAQGIGLRRTKRSLAPLERALKPGQLVSSEQKIEGYHQALQGLIDKVTLTDSDKVKIARKSNAAEGSEAYTKEADRFLQEKIRKLKRRVGKELVLRIQCEAQMIQSCLRSDNTDKRHQAYVRAQALLLAYKGVLYKDVAMRVAKIALAVVGFTASALFLANPVGATITAGIMIVAVAAATIYLWRAEKSWKGDHFEKGITLFGRTYNKVEVPSARDIIYDEMKLELRDHRPKYKLRSGEKTFAQLCEEYAARPKQKPKTPTFYESFREKAKVVGPIFSKGAAKAHDFLVALAA